MIVSYKISEFFNEPIKLDSFHINRLEEMPSLPISIKSPHKHKFMEVFLMLEGSMEHNIDFQKFIIKKPSIFFISEGQFHFWTKSNWSDLKGYRLMFEENFIQHISLHQGFLFELVYLNNIYQNPLVKINLQQQERLLLLFDLLHKEYIRNDYNLKALQANLFLLLLEVQRIAVPFNLNNDRIDHLQLFQKFNNLVDTHYKENKQGAWYAKSLNVSSAQLNRVVAKYGNIPVGQFVHQRRILEAKRLLYTTSKSVQEIAFDLGFVDHSYFIRFFKKYVQSTPQEFRNKM